MNFESRSFEAILQEMLMSIPDRVDKSEGSPIYNALAPAAVKLFETYVAMEQILKLMFAQTTQGEWLDLKVAEENITRYQATPSIRHFETSGSGMIVQGSRFFVDGIYFVAKEGISVPGVFQAQSEETGRATAIFNPRTILPLETVDGLERITMVHHHDSDIDGVDTETDEALLVRYWEKIRHSPGPGTISDYKRWAREIQGVGEVKVSPLWNGPGTVLLVILNLEGREAPPYLIETVQEYIDPNQQGIGEGVAPIGAKVTVSTAVTQELQITVKELVFQGEVGDVRERVEGNLRSALSRINIGGIVRIREIESILIQTEGVTDFSEVRINGNRANVELLADQLAALDEVIFIE